MKKLLVISLALLLAACAPTPTPNTNNNSGDGLPTPTREGDLIDSVTGNNGDITGDLGSGFGLDVNDLDDSPFSAAVTGGVELMISGNGILSCENNLTVIRASISDFPQITLILPQGAGAGSYELSDNRGTGENASASLFLADGRVFAAGVDGLLVLNNLATAPNEAVTGSFFFSANNGTDVVDVQGVFNFLTTAETSFCQ